MSAGADGGAVQYELAQLRSDLAAALATTERFTTTPGLPPLSRQVAEMVHADLMLAARRCNWLIAAAVRRGAA